MSRTTKLVLILIILGAAVFFGARYFDVAKELKAKEAEITTSKTNDAVIAFTSMFIQEVLKAKTEVDFETRLKLENAVRNLNDEHILAQWRKFVESKSEAEAQAEVKNLLELLVKKIKTE